jgi:hypothetical protein
LIAARSNPREMIELQAFGIGQHRAQVRRGIFAAGHEAHQMLVSAPIRNLHQAEAIARGDEAHGFGIHCDRAGCQHVGRQVFLVKINAHAVSPSVFVGDATRRFSRPVAGPDVQGFHHRRKGHGGIDITLGHVHAEAIGDQHRADHQQEAQSEHDHRGVAVDEVRKRISSDQHHAHGDDHGGHHDRNLVGHPDGSEDRIDGEDHVERDDLHDRRAEADRGLALLVERLAGGLVIDAVMDLLGRLPD